MKYNLLVYGSLLNTASASAGLKRNIVAKDYHDISLQGYQLSFDTLETVLVATKTLQVCFLNLTEKEGSLLSLKYLKLSKQELEILSKREKNYNLVDISTHCHHSSLSVFTFMGKKEHLHCSNQPPLVLEQYIQKVCSGITCFETLFIEKFTSQITTASQHVAIISGDYHFASTLQNNLTN